MFKINCIAPDSIYLMELVPFQGDLKKRSRKKLEELKTSLLDEGLFMPFAVWQKDEYNYILDGHGRREALLEIMTEQPELDISSILFPCIKIKADTEDDAKKALLQITSTYGHFTEKGVLEFTASIPEYKAPAVNKYINRYNKKQNKLASTELPLDAIIKIKVPTDKKEQFVALLKQVDYITVL